MSQFKYCVPKPKSQFQPLTVTETILECRCEINEDGSKNLNLHGRDLNDSIGCRIQDSDLDMIFKFLDENPDIISVILCYNNITDEGMVKLSEFFKDNTTIQSLDLMMNDFETSGVLQFADIGAQLNLTSLRLNGNKFGREVIDIK